MFRSQAIRAIQSYLSTHYTGPVKILANEDDKTISPPYAVVRVGSSENVGENQYEVWSMTILVAVFQDADTTSAEDAETIASEVFSKLRDPAAMEAGLLPIVTSWWQPITIQASIAGNNWQHVSGYEFVAAPPVD